jgi:hypothetical protein
LIFKVILTDHQRLGQTWRSRKRANGGVSSPTLATKAETSQGAPSNVVSHSFLQKREMDVAPKLNCQPGKRIKMP